MLIEFIWTTPSSGQFEKSEVVQGFFLCVKHKFVVFFMSVSSGEGWSSDDDAEVAAMRQPHKAPPVDSLLMITPYPNVQITTQTTSLKELAGGKPVVLHLYTG